MPQRPGTLLVGQKNLPEEIYLLGPEGISDREVQLFTDAGSWHYSVTRCCAHHRWLCRHVHPERGVLGRW